ncbi:protein spitz [Drosophila nasuta]|uniref:Protein spitz n=1 Tax=Drosophila albomicans TaxID=7291 RepID=A0A6P8XCV5_DROAB|nr:protein spitz [Drosophila albomicans]XP_034110489.1 protein spitz [Drosophila albomicans]XP_034110490.1 protein spitz [Drosophila albomicans]XP_060659734.1 protein spitz [Drosophila nasuta]XP_060659735.1 protein spitz [Drosophila nasuta]XP_060659736.1 protein spitz [Drosophila nasuta]
MRLPLLLLPLIAASACLLSITAACSSRAITKPRPEAPPPEAASTTVAPSTAPDNVIALTTPSRPNITFPIFRCPPTYAAWYCLNDATCFTVEIHNEVLYNCECALGFMGPRCEYKEIDGTYLPTRNRVMLEKASIVSGATLAVIFMAMCCVVLYLRHEKQAKQKLHAGGGGNDVADMAFENAGVDEVDGLKPLRIARRPFGPHHSRILTLEQAYLQSATSHERERH